MLRLSFTELLHCSHFAPKQIFFRQTLSESLGIAPLSQGPANLFVSHVRGNSFSAWLCQKTLKERRYSCSSLPCQAKKSLVLAVHSLNQQDPINLNQRGFSYPPFTPSTPVKIVLPLSRILFLGAGNQENMPNIMKNICFWKKL